MKGFSIDLLWRLLNLTGKFWGNQFLEIINSAIEGLVDLVQPEFDPRAGKIKDLAAASVLVGAVFAALVGLIVFLNPIVELISRWLT